MIVEDVGIEPYEMEGGRMDEPQTKYWIKILVGNKWYVNKDKSYTLEGALAKRDEELDGVRGRRGG